MANENNNKDVANSLSGYSNTLNKGTNVILDTANQINKWYAEQLDKITESEEQETRLETNVDNSIEDENSEIQSKIETKVDDYNELQTNNQKGINIKPNANRLQTQAENNEIDIEGQNGELENEVKDLSNNKSKIPKRIGTIIKGVKVINNTANKFVKTGKTLNTAVNEGGLKSFENSSSRIMTRPVKNVANKVVEKATNKLGKKAKKLAKNSGKKIVKGTVDATMKAMKLVAKLIEEAMKILLSMLPSIAPIIIIILIIAAFCSFFGIGMSEDTKKYYENYMIGIQDEYDKQTTAYYNSGKIVDGTIEGKGMINWKAPLAIIQVLNGDLIFDWAEVALLTAFHDAGLYEKITEESYTYEKTITETDSNGNTTTRTETVTETKMVVTNPSIDDYIKWCNDNFEQINNYKLIKTGGCDPTQTKFKDSEVEQIKMLYSSSMFFDLFSSEFKDRYAYLNVSIGDEQINAIYNEFLNNVGTRYLMDHSNLSHDNCMEYYDCSSWVIHCLAHTGIKVIPNTTAGGIYRDYCVPINVDSRQAGDLIFLKDTYDTDDANGISHIGIYMGELTINGETAQWVIDTGGNPEGVKIRKYNNGWWNGSHFYGFGRLK